MADLADIEFGVRHLARSAGASCDEKLRELVRRSRRRDHRSASSRCPSPTVTHEIEGALAFGDVVARSWAVTGCTSAIGLSWAHDYPDDPVTARFVDRRRPWLCAGRTPTVQEGLPEQERRRAAALGLSVTCGGSAVVSGRRYLGSTWRYEVRREDGAWMKVDERGPHWRR